MGSFFKIQRIFLWKKVSTKSALILDNPQNVFTSEWTNL